MERNDIKAIIRRELPGILRADPEFRAFVLELTRERFAGKEETESRFDRLLEESKRKADRRLVISPMIEDKASQVADELGIEAYSYAGDVAGLNL